MHRHLPSLAAAVIAMQVGATIVATRLIVDQAGPASLALIRYVVGTLCLLAPVLLAGRIRVAPRDALAIGVLGTIQFGATIALINVSLIYIPAARTALIFATAPLLTLLLAAAMRHERLTAPKTIGILVTIAGVTLALGEKALQGAPGATGWLGEAAAILAALCNAACSVFFGKLVRRYPSLPVATLAMAAAVVALMLPAFFEGFLTTSPQLTAIGWLTIILVGVSSGVFYYLWVWTLSRTTATRVAMFLALSPITAALLGWLFLSEPVTPGLVAGLLAVAAGLILAHRPTPGEHTT